MKLKMSRELATLIVEGWKADCDIQRIGELCAYLIKINYFIPFTVRIRVLIGEQARLASDALWEGKFDTAVIRLMKYGIDTKARHVKRPYRVTAYIKTNRMSGRERAPGQDWKYVK